MTECSKAKECANYRIKCHECYAMSDMYNHHPCYQVARRLDIDLDKDMLVIRLGMLVKPDVLQKIRDDIYEQCKHGVVVIPPYMSVSIVPKDIEVKFVEKGDKK